MADMTLPLAAGSILVVFSFNAGGFFAGIAALVATGLLFVIALTTALARRPFAGLSRGFVAGLVLLALFALWTFISITWSDTQARTLIEHDRVLVYLAGFVLLGAQGRTSNRMRWMVRAIALAASAVCVCGLLTRLFPDYWQLAPEVANERLNYPLTYWNSLGLLAAVGIVLCLALTSDGREAPTGRVLAAAALPALAVTLLLTFSRGALAAGAVGLIALILLGRPRALLSGLIVAIPTVFAVVAAYGADLLASDRPTTAAAAAQGHELALTVALCTVLAVCARLVLLLQVDARLLSRRRIVVPRRPAIAAAAGICVCLVLVFVATSGSAYLGRQYDSFVKGDAVNSADARSRLGKRGNNGRIELWRVALDELGERPLHGTGAGTFALRWDRRGTGFQAEDAHSLYVEVLGELGLIGLLLVGGVVALVLCGFLARARGPDRVVGAALFGAGLTWAAAAGVDWVWEMPAVTFWFFAAGGLALSAQQSPQHEASVARSPEWPMRLAVAASCGLLALTPARMYLSDGPLRASARALKRGDCRTAVDRALDSIAAFGVRPEPYILLGYCDLRLGQPRLAVGAMKNAVRLEPDGWEGHYGLALARAAMGSDPRPRMRIARRQNPRSPLPLAALRRFETDDPGAWQAAAPGAPLPAD